MQNRRSIHISYILAVKDNAEQNINISYTFKVKGIAEQKINAYSMHIRGER
jgi:hypothetical protein